jgi:GntR family transcriptional regulator
MHMSIRHNEDLVSLGLFMLPSPLKITVMKESPVPIRDQLVEQIGLQVASGVLKSNEKLPSIRALAQRLGIHHGMVNAAYNQLAEIGMLEIRQGSGVRVGPKINLGYGNKNLALETMFMQFVAKASEAGYSAKQINACCQQLGKREPVKRIVFVDRNPDFYPVILTALTPHFALPITTTTSEDLKKNQDLIKDSMIITSLYHFLPLQSLPLDPTRFMICNVAPAQDMADTIKAVPEGSIVLFVSISPTLLKMGANIAAGLRGESIAIRTVLANDAQEIAYMMRYAKIVICDQPSQAQVIAIAGKVPVKVFDLYPKSTIEAIKNRLAEWG